MMEIKNVGMIGRGAVGTIFANLIQQTLGKEHFCMIADEQRVKYYEQTPFYCNGEVCDFNYVYDVKQFQPLDLLFIVVKYPMLKEALEIIRAFVKEDTIIVCLLNGISSEGIVEETLGKGIVIHSIAQLMDAVKSGNEVTYTNMGEIVIGSDCSHKMPALFCVDAFLTKVNIPHYVAKDIIHDQWSKLMLNCGINQICAVYDVPYGACQQVGKLRDLLISTMQEVAKVAACEGVVLSEEEVDKWVRAVDRLDAQSMPSMRQDRLAKRYSEVDLFAKTIIELSKKHHLDVPINRYLYDKIKEMEEKY
ncbi:MAG: 2-dehydropantoate 2-reductase [Erysipelotrichia bacterium]|nr:2-dehydropantoate 2-reductase [Erysipelotrichia bacterium]NCC53901.1 2-dehydropantoate 2-reductase [Erysipelotrichia bacterium]